MSSCGKPLKNLGQFSSEEEIETATAGISLSSYEESRGRWVRLDRVVAEFFGRTPSNNMYRAYLAKERAEVYSLRKERGTSHEIF